MEEERDIELAEEMKPQKHQNDSVTVKWFCHAHEQWRRFECSPWNYANLMCQIRAIEPNFRGSVFYRDNEHDLIAFRTNAEMDTMLNFFREELKTNTVKLESPKEKSEQMTEVKAQDKEWNKDKPLHPYVICDQCDLEVYGRRYKCLICPDFDLCERCEQKGTHAEHAMCRLATPETQFKHHFISHSMHQPHVHHQSPPLHTPLEVQSPPPHMHHQQRKGHDKTETKLEKWERKFLKKLGKREQHLRDRAFRAVHRTKHSFSDKKDTQSIQKRKIVSVHANANNNYICAEQGGSEPLVANRRNIDEWELFVLEENEDGTISLLSKANNKYVAVDLDHGGRLIARSDSVGECEKFQQHQRPNGAVALQAAANGHFVCADLNLGGVLVADRTEAKGWETFHLEEQAPKRQRRVEHLKEIGQRVQQALLGFGIECDAEIRDASGNVQEHLPFVLPPAENKKEQLQQHKFKQHCPQLNERGQKCIGKPPGNSASGVFQRQVGFVCPAYKNYTRTNLKDFAGASRKSAGLQDQQLRDAIRKADKRAAELKNHGVEMDDLKQRVAQKRIELQKLMAEREKAKAVGQQQQQKQGSKENTTISSLTAPFAGETLPSVPTLAEMEREELSAALSATQEAVKHASHAALSGFEAATQIVGEILSGFDPNTGQSANNFGANFVQAARQRAENLTDKLPEVFAVLLQPARSTPGTPPNTASSPRNAPNTPVPQKQENVIEEKRKSNELVELGEEVAVNVHLERAPHPELVPSAIPMITRQFGDLCVQEGTADAENVAVEVVAEEDVSAANVDSDSDVKILESEHLPPEKNAQPSIGCKRKLSSQGEVEAEAGEDLMRLSTHSARELGPNDEQKSNSGGSNEELIDSFDLSSVSSRSSSTTSSDSSSGSGWMVVNKESFKKLCDFYEKRRRLEDPFAVQLDREMRETLGMEEEHIIGEGKEQSTPEGNNEGEDAHGRQGCVHSVLIKGVCAKCGVNAARQSSPDIRADGEPGHSAQFLPPVITGTPLKTTEPMSKPADNVTLSAKTANDRPADALYPVLVEEEKPKKDMSDNSANTNKADEICTAGMPYRGFLKQDFLNHTRRSPFKHHNLVVQQTADQLVEMGFDNCNGWLFRLVEEAQGEMDKVFAAIEADPMHNARLNLF